MLNINELKEILHNLNSNEHINANYSSHVILNKLYRPLKNLVYFCTLNLSSDSKYDCMVKA